MIKDDQFPNVGFVCQTFLYSVRFLLTHSVYRLLNLNYDGLGLNISDIINKSINNSLNLADFLPMMFSIFQTHSLYIILIFIEVPGSDDIR